MLIIDAHLDLAWNAMHNNRDVTCTAHDIRAQETDIEAAAPGLATVGIPDLQRGCVAASLPAAVWRTADRLTTPAAQYPTVR